MKKSKKPIDELIEITVSGYLKWFEKANTRSKHRLYFFTVPAPIFDPSITDKVNKEVSDIVQIFNKKMIEIASTCNLKVIDVYSATCDSKGFSNKKYNIDNRHLGPNMIPIIEKQIVS